MTNRAVAVKVLPQIAEIGDAQVIAAVAARTEHNDWVDAIRRLCSRCALTDSRLYEKLPRIL